MSETKEVEAKVSRELSLAQAIIRAQEWQDNSETFFPPEILTALLEGIEAQRQ